MKKVLLATFLMSVIGLTSCEQKKSGTVENSADSLSMRETSVPAKNGDSIVQLSKNEMDLFIKSVPGKYVASNCNGGRFSIEISNGSSTSDALKFQILDGSKVIKSGEVNIDGKYTANGDINLGLEGIGGLFQKDKIVVQNSGNNMNPFEHFKQCGDKYINFTKQ
ncbi:hypothetical protein FY557_13160 [Chryseobacterium sp. SN22]|uniref:hypothetical protein n=1 Tax=Chryseobacterium sp. SN22 TaxID=2606431 RepID=UPI0011EF0C0C|nr:hypothetical protein [Chryseobacterium sp. SN22]KAA0127327.1 hypothetical protein FY557_13160 [Chryseobacterium sp. SN22]